MEAQIAVSQNQAQIAIGVWFALLYMLGLAFPLRRMNTTFSRRIIINIIFTALSLAVAWLCIRPVTWIMLSWSGQYHFGILGWLALPLPWEIIAGFLLMDLSFYYWHRANHRFHLLWRFHNVHHVDADMDTTTSFRFHPVETAYSSVFRVLQIGIIGVSLQTYMWYELSFLAITIFHHSNVRLPIAIERTLNLFIVTPRMHGIHHSVEKEETNSNYSSVLRWWDLLHGTLVLNVPQERIRIGIAAYQGPRIEKTGFLLTMPFRQQRNYWVEYNQS